MFKPQLFYALHFAEGCAQYKNLPGEPIVMVRQQTMKNMDPTFTGCPVYVDHVDNVGDREPDGVVVRSFYNKADGKHWAEFLVTTQKGLDAIRKGWRVSNSYNVTGQSPGGVWHGIDFGAEITDGVYDHLAIVEKPRYRESIVLTPEEFKQYNIDKESELFKLANSEKTEEGNDMLNFFTSKKVDNADEVAKMSVTLPKSKKTVSINELVQNADEAEMKKGEVKKANEEDMVEVENGEMSVGDLKREYANACKKNSEYEAEKKKNEEEAKKKENQEDPEKKENEDDKDKKENTEDPEKDKKDNSEDFFNKIKNAESRVNKANNAEVVYKTPGERAESGRKKYGAK